MVACEPGPGTRAFCTKEEEDRTPLVRWGDRGLKRELMEIAGREDDEKNLRVYGRHDSENNAVFFDLTDNGTV